MQTEGVALTAALVFPKTVSFLLLSYHFRKIKDTWAQKIKKHILNLCSFTMLMSRADKLLWAKM